MRKNDSGPLMDQRGTTTAENVVWVALLFVILALMALILAPALYQEFVRIAL